MFFHGKIKKKNQAVESWDDSLNNPHNSQLRWVSPFNKICILMKPSNKPWALSRFFFLVWAHSWSAWQEVVKYCWEIWIWGHIAESSVACMPKGENGAERSGAEQSGGGSVHFGILDTYPLGPICCGSRLCSASHCKICCLSSSLGRIWSMVKGLRLKGSVWSLCEHRSYKELLNGMLQFGWAGEVLKWVFLHSDKFSFCKRVNTC